MNSFHHCIFSLADIPANQITVKNANYQEFVKGFYILDNFFLTKSSKVSFSPAEERPKNPVNPFLSHLCWQLAPMRRDVGVSVTRTIYL